MSTNRVCMSVCDNRGNNCVGSCGSVRSSNTSRSYEGHNNEHGTQRFSSNSRNTANNTKQSNAQKVASEKQQAQNISNKLSNPSKNTLINKIIESEDVKALLKNGSWQGAKQAALKITEAQTTSKPGNAFMSHVDAFNSGVERAKDDLVDTVKHPVETAKGLGLTIWDGYNALADVTLGVSDENSRKRNQERGESINATVDDLVNGDSTKKTEVAASAITSVIFGGAVQGGYGLFSKNLKLKPRPGIAEVGKIISEAEREFYSKAELIGTYDYRHLGALPDKLSETFTGSNYSTYKLKEDVILHRAGTKDKPLGQSFSFEQPLGELQTRIDKAIRPVWPNGNTSPIDTGFSIKIPKGTIVHVGEISNQGEIFLGGTKQIVIEQPNKLIGLEVLETYQLNQEKLWAKSMRK